MKIKFILTLFVSLVCFFPSFAQNRNGKVTGSIVSDEGTKVEGATVSLLKAKDSVLAKLGVTSKTGNFELEKLALGKYLLKVTSVGYTTFYTKVFEIAEGEPVVNLSTISLKVNSSQLADVKVTASRPLIENKIDKTVVNVEASVTNVGSTALEVLEKSPGISVDRDGNISLKGKQGVIILMDGKPTYLGGADLANLLRNMSANQLDQIEIMSQPSARFDASGNSGVINIKTKRNQQKGFNGSVSVGYTQGFYPKSSNSFNINSRKGKVNVFANYGYSYFKGFNELSLTRNFRDKTSGNLLSTFRQTSNMTFTGQPHTIKAGLDFFATKKTTMGFVLGGIFNKRRNNGVSETRILSSNNQLDSINRAINSNIDPWTNYSANLNFRHIIDTTGKEITADADYVHYDTKSQMSSNNYTYYPNGAISPYQGNPFLLRGILPSIINIYTAKVDYIHPLKKGARFEAGVKTSIVKTDNDAPYQFRDNTDNTWKTDRRTNHFIYNENINAAYINASKQYKKVGVQLGLRVENTNSEGEQRVGNVKPFNRHYTQLFPTAYVSYAANKVNNFGVSYGKRIERPSYQDMNPFQYFLDQYTYREGNPFLTPQFSHNVEVSHNYKGQLNTSLNYTNTTDIINDVLIQNDLTRVTFQTKRNIATRRNIGLSVSYNRPLTKYWTVSLFTNVFNNKFEGFVNNKYLSTQYSAFMVNMTNSFKFNKGWSAELSGFYRSATLETGLIKAFPMGVFSMGVGKQVLKNKGTVRLNLRDPFWIQKFKGETKFDNIDMVIQSRWDNRQVSVNFTYRFGKNQNNIPQRKRSAASQEEQNRVGQGGNQ